VLTTLGHRPDWGIPVVLTRTLDGRLFAPVRAAPPAPATTTAPTTQSDRNLRVLRQKVRSFWVDGVLHNSLAQAVLIDLGLTERSEAVLPQWDAVVQRSGEADQHLPPGTLLVDVFDEQEQALLILGAPGAGKTTMMLELARVLLDRAERDLSFPAPVVFNLSSWATRRGPLEEWLVEELFARYDVPRKLGRQWVDAGQVLPLLDGLDEVTAEHRDACAAAINTFREAHGLVPIAVCCRTGDYEALTTKLTLRGAVVVQLLAPEQIDSALALGGEPLARLRTAVREDEGLRELAQTPLMLSVMMLAYHGTAAAIAPGAGRAEQRATIFDAYIEAMFSRRGVPLYGRDTMLAWLAWMAREMQRQALSIFQIEGLQPEWLPDSRARSTYWLVDRLGWGGIAALVVGIAAAIVAGIAAGPVAAVVLGLSAGLSLGLGIALVGGDRQGRATHHALRTLGVNALVGGAVSGLAGALIGAVVGGTATGLVASFLSGPVIGVGAGIEYALRIGLAVGLGAGIVGGLGSALTGRPGVRPRSVVVVSQVRWSWRKALRTMLVVGLGVGLVVAVVGAGLFTLSSGLTFGLGAGIGFGLVFGLVAGLGAGLIGGLQTGDVTTTSRPNEGIRRSARMAAVIGGVAFAIVFVLAVLLRFGVLGGAVFGLAFALPVALAYGGYAVLSHLALRLILWRRRLAPWHYAAFLDSAADRVFLRKVGGGYIFIHRLLLEHLASGAEPREAAVPEEVTAHTAGATG
jgi:eukaryotic-like serine/threonine-protein kinase